MRKALQTDWILVYTVHTIYQEVENGNFERSPLSLSLTLSHEIRYIGPSPDKEYICLRTHNVMDLLASLRTHRLVPKTTNNLHVGVAWHKCM